MNRKRIGTIRVSPFEQNPKRQLGDIQVDRTFTDKASGKDVKRSQLKARMNFVRTGDTVVVHGMDRLARNFDYLRRIVPGVLEGSVSDRCGRTCLVVRLKNRNRPSCSGLLH